MTILRFLPVLCALLLMAPAFAADDLPLGYELERIDERVSYLTQRPALREAPSGNIVLFRQTDGIVLYDTGTSAAVGRALVRLIDEDPLPLKAIVISHWHDDHPLGLQPLTERWPDVPVFAAASTLQEMRAQLAARIPTSDDPAFLEKLKDAQQRLETYLESRLAEEDDPAILAGYRLTLRDAREIDIGRNGQTLVYPAHLLEGTLHIDDPVLPLVVALEAPANTEGDITIWSPANRVLATGDIYVRPLPFAFGSHPDSWPGALRRLASLEPRTVIPGHGDAETGSNGLTARAQLIEAATQQLENDLDNRVDENEAAARVSSLPEARPIVDLGPWQAKLFTDFFAKPMIANLKRGEGQPAD